MAAITRVLCCLLLFASVAQARTVEGQGNERPTHFVGPDGGHHVELVELGVSKEISLIDGWRCTIRIEQHPAEWTAGMHCQKDGHGVREYVGFVKLRDRCWKTQRIITWRNQDLAKREPDVPPRSSCG